MTGSSDAPKVRRGRTRAVLLYGVLPLAVAFLLLQLVPYRVTNPSTRDEPAWDSPRTRELAVVACFDCHSNESEPTSWERIAPLSWWITNHVDEGRDALNFSEWGRRQEEADDAAETVIEGSMPPDYYTWLGLHADAKLTKAERRELAAGLRRTFAASGGGG